MAAPPLAAASGTDHLWFVLATDRQSRRFDLCHVPADGSPFADQAANGVPDAAHYRVQANLAGAPEAIAAAGARVWLAFPPTPASAGASREVFTASVVKHTTLGLYFSEPQGRLEASVSLPGTHRLAAFVAGAAGPLALLLPEPAATASSGAVPQRAALMQLVGDQWSEIALPVDLDAHSQGVFLAADPTAGTITLLTGSRASAEATTRYDRTADGPWRESSLAVSFARLRATATLHGELYAALRPAGSSTIEVVQLGAQRVRPVAAVPAPQSSWTLIAFGSNLRLIAADTGVTLRSIQPLTGEVGPAQALVLESLSAGRIWQFSLVIGLSLSLLLLLVIVRPAPVQAAVLTGLTTLPLLSRCVAMLVDLMLAGFAAAAIFDASVAELLLHPLLSFSLAQSAPFLTMAGLAVAHETAGELIAGRSVGKALMGGRVVNLTGGRPRVWQALARNLIKLITLLAPPLAIVAFTNPAGRALHDVAARTLVVRAEARAKQPKTPTDE